MNDISKVYNLLEQFYIEFQDNKKEVNQRLTSVDQRLTSVDQRLTSVEQRLTNVDQRLCKVETNIENDIMTKIQTLHERVEINTTKLDEHTNRLSAIENKLDYLVLSVNSQDKRLSIIEKHERKAK